MTSNRSCLLNLLGCLAWPALLLAVAAGVVIGEASDASGLRWLGVASCVFGSVASLLFARSTPLARGLEWASTVFSNTDWDEKYEADYRVQTGVHPGPMLVALMYLLGAALYAAIILFP
jgi:hypothetical protein